MLLKAFLCSPQCTSSVSPLQALALPVCFCEHIKVNSLLQTLPGKMWVACLPITDGPAMKRQQRLIKDLMSSPHIGVCQAILYMTIQGSYKFLSITSILGSMFFLEEIVILLGFL